MPEVGAAFDQRGVIMSQALFRRHRRRRFGRHDRVGRTPAFIYRGPAGAEDVLIPAASREYRTPEACNGATIGIDLGTTNSALAYLNNAGNPEMVENCGR